MDNDKTERLKALAYNTHLNNLISGMSEEDLKNLGQIITDRLNGLEEIVPLPKEVKRSVHEFVEGVNETLDNFPMPSQAEADYFLNKAKKFAHELLDMTEEMSLVWSWLEEHEKRGRLTKEQRQKLVRLRHAMYYEAGLDSLCHHRRNLPEELGRYSAQFHQTDVWYDIRDDEPEDDHFLQEYRENLP
jgi:hypothetical protein